MPKPLAVVTAAPLAPAPAVSAAPLRAWLEASALVYREREPLLRALALALVCPRPTNVLVVGPPGTAKTTLARALADALGLPFLGATLSPWTDAAELLGPVDLGALQAGRLERSTTGRPTLLTAQLVLADELSRAAPGIRAMMLSALSDRLTPTGDPVPAHVIVAGTNMRLTSEEDQAMADRFALRVEAPYLVDEGNLAAVIAREGTVDGFAPAPVTLPAIDPALLEALRSQAARVDLPGDIARDLARLALALRQPAPSGAAYPVVSDRRWVIVAALLRAHAALHDRDVIAWADLIEVLPLALDDGPESRAALRAAIDAAIPVWVRVVEDVRRACAAAVERAARVGAGEGRPGEGDAHGALAAELRALADSCARHSADVRAKVDAMLSQARVDARDAYQRGVDAAERRLA